MLPPVLQVEMISPIPRYPRAPRPSSEPYDPWEFGSYTFWRTANPDDQLKVRGRKP